MNPPRSMDAGIVGRTVPARVLVVDDDERSRVVTSALLRAQGIEIVFASSGDEALQVAQSVRPDLVLLDVMMPGVDGFEVCRRLRADPEIAEIRVFLLTALDDDQSRMAGFEAGADDFLTKPLNGREALSRIRSLARLNRFRALVDQRRQLEKVREAMPSMEHLPSVPAEELNGVLDQALASLHLFFQPIVATSRGTKSQEVVAFEGLLRSGSHVLTNPDSVIAASTLLGRHHDLGRAVRESFAKEIAAHPEVPLFFANLNASDLMDERLYAADEPLLPFARRIVLEITERESLQSVSEVRKRMASLRQKGFRIALDDLGNGYSNFTTLALIEPEFVKLDRSLIMEVHENPVKQKIITSLISLANELGIGLIVEGVETEREREKLVELGCLLQQGYLFGRPSRDLAMNPPGSPQKAATRDV